MTLSRKFLQGSAVLALTFIMSGCGPDASEFRKKIGEAKSKADLVKIEQELNEASLEDKNEIRGLIADKFLAPHLVALNDVVTPAEADRLSGDILADMNPFKDIRQGAINDAIVAVNGKKAMLFKAMIDKAISKDDIRRIDRDIDSTIDFPAKEEVKIALSSKILALYTANLVKSISISDADYIEKEAAIAFEPYKNLNRENPSMFLKNYYTHVLKLVLDDQGRRDKIDYIAKIYNDILNDNRLLTSHKNDLYAEIGKQIATLIQNEMKTELEKDDKRLGQLKEITTKYISDMETKKELLAMLEFERLKLDFKTLSKFDQLKNLSTRLDSLGIEAKLKDQFVHEKLVRNKVKDVVEGSISGAKEYEQLKAIYKGIGLMSVIPEEDKRTFERKVTDKLFTMLDLEK